MAKNKNVQAAVDSRSKLEKVHAQIQKGLDKVSPEQLAMGQKMLGEFSSAIDRASDVTATVTSYADLLSSGVGVVDDISKGKDLGEVAKDVAKEVAVEILEKTVGEPIDKFLKEYGNYKGELLSYDISQSIGPFFGCVNIDIGFSASIEAALESKRKAASITSKASLTGNARVSVGISIGFNVATFKCSIGAGIQGGPDLKAEASITLAVKGVNLVGSVNPATLAVSLAAELYFSVPSVIPEDFISWAAEQMGLGSSGNKILYPLGTIDVLTVTTPSYSITFEISRGRFSGATKQGEFKVEVNEKIKNAANSVYSSLSRAVTELPARALEAVGDAVEGAVDTIVDVAKDTAELIEDVDKAVDKAVDTVIDDAKALAEKAAKEIADAAAAAKKLAAEKARWAKKKAEEAAAAAEAKAKQLLAEAEDKARELARAAEAKARELAADAERIARETAAKVEKVVDDLGDAAKTAYKEVSKKVDSAIDTGREIVSDVSDTLGDAADAVSDSKYAPWNW